MKQRELLLALDRASDKPIFQQVYEQICSAISNGDVSEGDVLPSIRQLSADYGISRGTAEHAYTQLLSEGFVESVPRVGYIAARLDEELPKPEGDKAPREEELELSDNRDTFRKDDARGQKVPFDFSYTRLPDYAFPVRTWQRLTNEVFASSVMHDMSRYSYITETDSLNTALAGYLGRARRINCTPQQVITRSGTYDTLCTILQIFDPATDVIGIEEPGYPSMHYAAGNLGFKMAPLPVKNGYEGFMQALLEHDPKAVFVTPSHQFPTGQVMPAEIREELLAWAVEHEAWIIEDDSCHEYRYGIQPIPSLQSQSPAENVVYVGNFSKALSPALRVSYCVMPPKIYQLHCSQTDTAFQTIPLIEREVLARFISQGYWERQIRRIAMDNHRRHDALESCLRDVFGDRLEVGGTKGGMHFFATVRNDMSQQQLVDNAHAKGAQVYGTKRFWISESYPQSDVIIGFSYIGMEDIPAGVAALEKAWFPA